MVVLVEDGVPRWDCDDFGVGCVEAVFDLAAFGSVFFELRVVGAVAHSLEEVAGVDWVDAFTHSGQFGHCSCWGHCPGFDAAVDAELFAVVVGFSVDSSRHLLKEEPQLVAVSNL